MGLQRSGYTLGRAVRLWLLQYHDHVYGIGPYFPAAMEASFLVRVLPYGNHDAVNLQSKT